MMLQQSFPGKSPSVVIYLKGTHHISLGSVVVYSTHFLLTPLDHIQFGLWIFQRKVTEFKEISIYTAITHINTFLAFQIRAALFIRKASRWCCNPPSSTKENSSGDVALFPSLPTQRWIQRQHIKESYNTQFYQLDSHVKQLHCGEYLSSPFFLIDRVLLLLLS